MFKVKIDVRPKCGGKVEVTDVNCNDFAFCVVIVADLVTKMNDLHTSSTVHYDLNQISVVVKEPMDFEDKMRVYDPRFSWARLVDLVFNDVLTAAVEDYEQYTDSQR